MNTPSWVDRLTLPFAPRWTLGRMRARMAVDLLQRYYEGAATGRRTEGWKRLSGDGNAATRQGAEKLRQQARDLVRNNPYAKAALSAIVDHVVGWGISAKRVPGPFGDRWQRWAETPACDADDRLDFAGLQRQVVRTVAEAGECLVRRRIRRPEDGLPLPFQIQVLEPDYLDTSQERTLPNRGWITQGVEFSPIGDRVAYWLFPQHPGSTLQLNAGTLMRQSERIPASEIRHVFEPGRPGQQRGVSWFDAVIPRLRDLDEYEDAALYKQKVAACLAVIITDADGSGVPLGTTDNTTTPETDHLEPGAIVRFPAGNTATVVDPPSVSEHDAYTRAVLRSIATGLGIAYEDLTGDYAQVNFSSARMARLRAWDRVHAWRWTMLQPQFLDPVWAWAVQMAGAVNVSGPKAPVEWTAPPLPMLEPDREGLAYARNIRSGLMSLSEAHRELGYDPATILAEIKSDLQKIDAAGLILDSDPRRMSQQGVRVGAELATQSERIDDVGTLIRAGFEPADSLKVVGLPPITHTGILPVTVQPEDKPTPFGGSDNAGMQAIRDVRLDVARAFTTLERALDRQADLLTAASESRNGHPSPITVNSPVTIEKGAIEVAAPAPSLPAQVTIAEGAIRGGDVTLTPPPASQITVVRTPKVRRRRKKANPPPPEPA